MLIEFKMDTGSTCYIRADRISAISSGIDNPLMTVIWLIAQDSYPQVHGTLSDVREKWEKALGKFHKGHTGIFADGWPVDLDPGGAKDTSGVVDLTPPEEQG